MQADASAGQTVADIIGPDTAQDAAKGEPFATRIDESWETRWVAAAGLAVVAALVVVVWVAVAVLVGKARSDAVAENYREEFTSAAVFAEQSTRTIRLLDAIMQIVAHELAKSPTPGRLKDLVDEKVIPLDTLVNWSFVGPDGRAIGSNQGPDETRQDLSAAETVRVHLDRKVDGLFIGKPVAGSGSGPWSIQLSRRVDGASGETLGVLVASIDPHYFERSWKGAGGPRREVDELIGVDGVLRATTDDVDAALAAHEDWAGFIAEVNDRQSGFIAVQDKDGKPWHTAFVRLEGLPLIAAAAAPASLAADESRAAVIAYAGFGAAITVVIAGFSVLLARLGVRLRERTRRAQVAERRMSLAIETIPQGFALFDPDDRLALWNDAYRKIYATSADLIRPGVRFEELLRAGLARGQYADARGREEEWLRARIAEHRNPSGALEQLTDSGRWLRIEERKTSDGSVVGLRSDITELKRRTFELSRQTSLLQTTLQHMGEGIAVYDRDRRLIAWNGLCSDLLQTPPDVFREGVPFDHVIRLQQERGDFGSVDFESDLKEKIASFHAGAPWTRERRRKDGRTIEIRCQPMPDGGAVFLYRDITERSEAEARLNAALRKAEEASKAKSGFLAMISHEIRTPMNAIMGLSALLGESDLGETDKRYAGAIEEAGERLLTLIDDLLDFSRLEAGKLSLEARPFDVRRLVASAIEIARAQPNADGLSIVAHVDDDVPEVLVGDGGRINQVLLNLVGNAVKFTERGGVTVRVLCGKSSSGRSRLRCEVADTGPGIEPAQQARLFEPFERGPASETRAVSGAGLGLAICRQLIGLMDGDMGLVSKPGEGSTFWFEIPARAARDEGPKPVAPAPLAAPSRPLTVLVAEDIEANRTVIGAMLQTLGHVAHMVEDGEQAIAAARAGDYDVILMDVQMPRVNGLEAIRAIREFEDDRRRVPIVAVTAFAQDSDRKEAMNAGADGYLTKPLRKSDLQAALDAAAGAGEAAAPAAAPAFDDSILAELREDLGDESFARLLGRCVEDIVERLRKLEAAIAAGDGKQVRSLAHALKGLFAQFGATGAAAVASAAETGDEAAMAENVAALQHAAAAALTRFQELRGAAGA